MSNTNKTAEQKVSQPAPSATPHDVDPSQLITVVSGFHGRLVYRSPRTNEAFEWSGFGAEQDMELRDLKAAKNSHKAFFANNWFMFKPEDSWVINHLGLDSYYQNAISIDRFDEIFAQSPAMLKKTIANLSAGQKEGVSIRASELIKSNAIDSRKTIAALEEALGIKFTE